MKRIWLLLAFSAWCVPVLAQSAVSLKMGFLEHLKDMDQVLHVQEFVIQALKSEDIDVIFYFVPFSRAAEQLQNGTLDGFLPCTKEGIKDFTNVVLIEPSFVNTNIVTVSLKSNKSFRFENIDKLQGAHILNNDVIEDLIKRKHMQSLGVVSTQQAFTLLAKKRVDYVVVGDATAKAFLELNSTYKGEFIINPQVLGVSVQYIALNKKNAHLIPKIKKAIKKYLHDNSKKYHFLHENANKKF